MWNECKKDEGYNDAYDDYDDNKITMPVTVAMMMMMMKVVMVTMMMMMMKVVMVTMMM